MQFEYCYKILGLEKDASSQQITERYRQLIGQVHPDRNKAPYAAESFRNIRRAYRLLLAHVQEQEQLQQQRLQAQQSQEIAAKQLVPVLNERDPSLCRRNTRLTPSHRRFNWQLEEEYKGTRIKQTI